ncbi:phosphohydrolase [Nostoc linckia z18]|uniref:Phosphohydrolase n=2 Tax=Nostoc linckia TaxID=92942 RepID=A0A9Q5ZDF8_NOSLI|nr:HD family phosphohydrolase [Nostoc linckia]PHK29359.1 phosphohydrolase [Nostoc linckia z15]PHK44826.1 phosphohydrolase [Nostoc linckia z16]PHJ61386.1 phosphohydrolase [Nostoc linckia z1]PHJ64203.1 phosphohydrolase [Nostoc linckia z3]PHJ71831.1 phosphohydrolase [Nostoc linckia z2]
MKTTEPFLQFLTQQLSYWRRWYRLLRRKGKLFKGTSHRRELVKAIFRNVILFVSKSNDKSDRQKQKRALNLMAKSANTHSTIYTVVCNWIHGKRCFVILAIAIVSLTGVIGNRLYNQTQIQIGNPAPQTIRAPYTDSIEDKKKTEAERRAASKGFIAVLMINVQINDRINENLQKLLDDGNEIRTIAGAFPFFDTTALSQFSQHYLRSCSESEWQAVILALENHRNQQRKITGRSAAVPNQIPAKENSLWSEVSQNTDSIQAIKELEAYQLTNSEKSFASLIAQISAARQKYTQATAKLLQLESVSPETIYEESLLLNLSDANWENTQLGIHQSAERILTQGIPQGLPQNILQDAINLQIQTFVPEDAEPLASKVLLAVLQPNLQKDEEKTREKAQKAAAGVSPVMETVRQGQVIVKQGEQISAWDFEVLQHYHLIRRQVKWVELVKLGCIITVAIGIFVWVERHIDCQLRQRDRLLVLLLTLSVPGVIVMGLPYTTWSALGLLLGSFYGHTLGLTVVALLSPILAISLDMSKAALLAGVGGGILGSCIAQRLRSREELALLGVAIALTQGGIYLIVKVLIGQVFGSTWYIVLREAGLFASSGFVWSVIALGLSPYLERFFDLVTPIRLAELANPNRPLLKRLATETPGTFQHTLFVATLAEAAAKQLGCNVELVRAGALYHDIGKMHDPLGFIENQMGGPNKHDTEIKDPWKSAEIIKKHVSEGLVMARKHLLPTAIQAFIPEHQGTMLIAYFYHQAQQMAQEDPNVRVNEADFRYDGPIPQSRETGIVMLADACEAALRSLEASSKRPLPVKGSKVGEGEEKRSAKDVSVEQALTMLNNILRARWQDNQLIDSGLTREEMSKIAQIFVDVWQQFNHKRIAYPKLKATSTVRNS